MKLSFKEYKDRMMGCWAGKNIGGVLGAPFEGKRGIFDADFYTQDLTGNPPPNDDLDLQLVWLNAVEKYGANINAALLGEYWLSFIIPDWVEYGTGKCNLRTGILPPLSGHLSNVYKDSCGCFIRSELWACLAPGHPEIAARYAYEDAIVDHAAEGMYGEIFCAAMQSAAFVEWDVYKLLDIGLSYIPKDCYVAKAVSAALKSYRSDESFETARMNVMTAAPGTFGVQWAKTKDIADEGFPIGKPGFDTPSNIGIMVVGLLYGQGDFGRSICIANNCGEDTDCTAATLGALLGILSGYSKLPQKWLEPLNDLITTCCINKLNGGIEIPNTVTELTDRVLRITPFFLGRKHVDLLDPEGYSITAREGAELFAITENEYLPNLSIQAEKEPRIDELTKLGPYSVFYRFHSFNAILDYIDEPYITERVPRKLRVILTDSGNLRQQQFVTAKLYMSDECISTGSTVQSGLLQNLYKASLTFEFEVTADRIHSGKLEFVIDLSVAGRHSGGLIKATLFPKAHDN